MRGWVRWQRWHARRSGAVAQWSATGVAAAIAMATLVALSAACDGTAIPNRKCPALPADGCVAKAGQDPCIDVTCSAVYTCSADLTWVRNRDCPARDAGTNDASRPDTSVRDAAIDAPPGAGGGPGCGTLQVPDCSLLLGLSCESGCCGCEDLYVCQDGGWQFWGTCQNGVIRPQ